MIPRLTFPVVLYPGIPSIAVIFWFPSSSRIQFTSIGRNASRVPIWSSPAVVFVDGVQVRPDRASKRFTVQACVTSGSSSSTV